MISQPRPQIALTQAHMDKQQKRLNQLNALHSSGVGLQSAVSDPTHPANPLVPQEQVLNKYAAMVISCYYGYIQYHMTLTRCQHQPIMGKASTLTVKPFFVKVVERRLLYVPIDHLRRS